MALCTPAATPCMPAAVAPCRPAEPAPALFDAVLYPNRSLGRFGFHLLMAAIVLASVAIGAAFMLAGAWPVTGFLGGDVLLLYLAFRWNYRQGRRAEFIRLHGAELAVLRVEPSGERREWRFDAHWVRVAIDDASGQLTLSLHGRRLAIAAFLTPEERVELGRALRAALAAHREMPERPRD